MKKIFFVFTLALVLLSGCFLFSQTEQTPQASQDELKLEKKIGIITASSEQDLLVTPSPYMLVTEAGEKVFVDSVSINFKKYIHRRVELEGAWNDGKTIFVGQNIASLGQETQYKQLYQSSAMGIKFQYPSIWLVSETKNVLGLNKIVITPYEVSDDELTTTDHITIERSENNRRLAARDWLNLDEKYISSDPNDSTAVFQPSKIGVSQMENAVKKTIGNGERVEFYIQRDTFIYRFIHITAGDADKDMYRNAFYDLVGSFEFIPFGESIGTSTVLISTPKSDDLGSISAQKNEQREVKEATTQEQQKTTNSREQLITYIKENISKFAPEPASLGGTWFVQTIAFAFPEGKPDLFNAAYVVYEDGHDLRKILITISDQTKPETMQQTAYFKPGSATDWVLVNGTDTTKDEEKALVTGAAQELVIKKGMALVDARLFKIKIQYPSNWYWAVASKGYNFSNKPVETENVLIRLTNDPQNLPENMTKLGDMSGKVISEGELAEAYTICLQGVTKYCLSGDPANKDIMKQMLYTIVEY